MVSLEDTASGRYLCLTIQHSRYRNPHVTGASSTHIRADKLSQAEEFHSQIQTAHLDERPSSRPGGVYSHFTARRASISLR